MMRRSGAPLRPLSKVVERPADSIIDDIWRPSFPKRLDRLEIFESRVDEQLERVIVKQRALCGVNGVACGGWREKRCPAPARPNRRQATSSSARGGFIHGPNTHLATRRHAVYMHDGLSRLSEAPGW